MTLFVLLIFLTANFEREIEVLQQISEVLGSLLDKTLKGHKVFQVTSFCLNFLHFPTCDRSHVSCNLKHGNNEYNEDCTTTLKSWLKYYISLYEPELIATKRQYACN